MSFLLLNNTIVKQRLEQRFADLYPRYSTQSLKYSNLYGIDRAIAQQVVFQTANHSSLV